MKRSLRNWPRDAWLLVICRALLMGANSLVAVALVLRVHGAGHGPLANAALFATLALPPILGMRVAGVVADRYDSRAVLTIAVAAQVGAALALAASDGLAWTYVWAFVFEAGFTFSSPVWSSLIPHVVGEDGVQEVAGVQMLASSLAAPLGAAAGGVLVEGWGTRTPPLAAAGTLALVLLGVLALKTRRHAGAGSAAERGQGGLASVRRDPVLAAVLAGALVLVLVAQGVNVVDVFLVRDELGGTAAQFGLSEVFFSVGAVAASVIVARLTTDRRRVVGIVVGFGLTAALLAAIGVVGHLWGYFALMLALGLTNSAATGALGPLFLLRTPEALRGRVMAVVSGAIASASVLALLVGGLAGAALGPRATFVAAGALGLAGVLGMALLVRRGLGATAPADAPQAGTIETDQPVGRPSA